MTKISDTAAVASIGAATRELRLPVVRAEAPRMAEAALRDRISHLGYLADGWPSKSTNELSVVGAGGSPRPVSRASSVWAIST